MFVCIVIPDDSNLLIIIGIAVAGGVLIVIIIAGVSFLVTWRAASRAAAPQYTAAPAAVFGRPVFLRPDMRGCFAPGRPSFPGCNSYYNNCYKLPLR